MRALKLVLPPVTEAEIEELRALRDFIAQVRAELGELTMELEAREQDIIMRVEAGAQLLGPASVVVRRRQNVSWLTIVTRELGTDVVERVKNSWPLTIWKELQLA
jgi:hypothetical protein